MKSLDLFSGYGGITLALKDFANPIAYCEIDSFCQKILKARIEDGSLPKAEIYNDVKELKGTNGWADIIVGGFPCQDISVAGTGKGLEGKRSGLFFEVVRLTKEIKPTFVFLENVPAIRTRGLEQVIKNFTTMGYDCRWTVVSAAEVGASHIRKRWFFLAHSNGFDSRNKWETEVQKNWKMDKWNPISDYDFQKGINSYMGRMVDGATDRMDRLKAIGNGVHPLQTRTAFKRLCGLK